MLRTCSSSFVTQYKTSFLRGSKLWIVMEYLGGGSCQDLIKAGPFSEAHVAIVCRELLRGLDYLHREGKIHRDIKAANVLLAHSGRVKLADFGVAAQLTNLQSVRNTFVGTPFWMAPEVIQEAGYDCKADIWSLGITAMELVNAEPPNAATHPMKVLFLIPKQPAPRLDGPHYSKELKDFVATCLVKDPDRRPSAKELLQHKFIRNAGRVEKLQELIQRRQVWDEQQGVAAHPKFYAETMVAMSPIEERDEWVFETVKASTVARPPADTATVTPRQVSSGATTLVDRVEQTTDDMMAKLSLLEQGPHIHSDASAPNTMRRRSTQRRAPATQQPAPSAPAPAPAPTPSSSEFPTQRRVSAGPARAPLGPDLSFGNAAAGARPFRRVSDNSPRVTPTGSLARADENRPPGGAAPSVEPMGKEARVGRRAYASAVDAALQATHAQTADRARREALARVAQAWAALDAADPEGEALLLRRILERVQRSVSYVLRTVPRQRERQGSGLLTWNSDPKLASLLPGDAPAKPKLVLAQNNPHLKSHRRRQSSVASVVDDDSAALEKNLPGRPAAPGLEHTRQLADVLYNKWVGGLQNRWPSMGQS